MSVEMQALEYQVAPDGRVSTNARYRRISRAEWDALPSVRTKRQERYGAALDEIAAGQMLSFPVPNSKKAWERRRTLRRIAQRRGLALELKTVCDPDVGGDALLVLARRA